MDTVGFHKAVESDIESCSSCSKLSSRFSDWKCFSTRKAFSWMTFVNLIVISAILYVYTLSLLRPTPVERFETVPINMWFISLSCSDKSFHLWAKIAVMSALETTNLIPILMLNGHDAEFEDWMLKRNVIIVPIQNDSFIDRVLANPKLRRVQNAFPLWTRFIIPKVITQLKNDMSFHVKMESMQKQPYYDYVLYTDVDIIFLKDFKIETKYLPRYISFPVQGNAWCCWNKFEKKLHLNDGVLLMNVTGYSETFPDLERFLYSKSESYNLDKIYRDQDAMHDFFPLTTNVFSLLEKVEMFFTVPHLRPTLVSRYYSNELPKQYMWEPFLGYNRDAVLLHWAGPKYSISGCRDLTPPIDYAKIDPYSLFGMVNYTASYLQPPPPEFAGTNHLLFVNDMSRTAAGYLYSTEIYLSYIERYCRSTIDSQQMQIQQQQQQQAQQVVHIQPETKIASSNDSVV